MFNLKFSYFYFDIKVIRNRLRYLFRLLQIVYFKNVFKNFDIINNVLIVTLFETIIKLSILALNYNVEFFF
jgi:hypothetical protein